MSLTSVDFPEPLTPVTAVSTPSGIVTSMFLRLFARAPRMTSSPFSAGRRVFGVGISRVPTRYAPVIDSGSSISARGVPWKITWPPRSPAPGPEVDHVVGDADGLFVVLDDDHGVAEIAKARERAEQLAIVPLVQPDGRFVEDVEHAGEVRANLRREANTLPFAARERRRAAAEREVADAHIVQKAQPLLDFLENSLGDDRFAVRELQAVDHVERFGNRQVDVVRDGPALHLHREALLLQALAGARGARTQRAVRLELLLLRPAPIVVPPAQVRDEALELLPLTKEQYLARLPRQPREGHREIDAEVARQALQRVAHELLVTARPGRDGAVAERLAFVRDDAVRIEVDHRPQSLAFGARAVRRVEREGARRHLRHAQPAVDAGEPPREQPIAALVRVDDDDVLGQVQGDVDRFGQPALDAAADDQAIDDDFDRVIAAAIQLDVLFERAELTVDARFHVAPRALRRQLFLELALASAHDRREDVDALVLRVEHHHVDDALERLAGDFLAAVRTVRDADVGEEEPQVVVDLRHRTHRRTRIRAGGLLFDGDGRRETFDQVDVRLLHLLEELARVRGQRLDIPTLSFGVDRVERQRRLAGAGQAGDDHQLVARDVDVDILQVVHASTAYSNPLVGH